MQVLDRAEEGTTRRRIMDAALELFAQHGYAGASMRMLARAAGLRESSLYNHFAGKDDLYNALIAQWGPAEFVQRLKSPEYRALADDPPAFFRLCGRHLVDRWIDPREHRYMAMISKEGPGGPGQYGGPQKKSSPIGCILMIVAGLAAIIVGVLFATGVLGGSDAEEKKPQAQAEVTATPTPTSEPTSADPTPEETATSEKPKPPVADLPDGMYQYGDWGIAVIEYNNDATAEVTALPTYADGSITPLEADQKFVGIKVRLKNLSSDTLNTNWDSPPGLVLYTSENTFDYSFEEFLFGDEPGTVPAIGDLAPGAEGEGWYYVIVPADFSGGKLSFWEYDTFSEADEGLSVPLQ